jgi:hypothetical protein
MGVGDVGAIIAQKERDGLGSREADDLDHEVDDAEDLARDAHGHVSPRDHVIRIGQQGAVLVAGWERGLAQHEENAGVS